MTEESPNVYTLILDKVRAAADALAAEGVMPRGLDLGRIVVEPPRDPAHGDMATNAAMVLAKDAKKRYGSERELADDLRRYLNNERILARPISSVERGWRWCRRNRALAIATGSAAALLVAVALISLWTAVYYGYATGQIKDSLGKATQSASDAKLAQESEKQARQEAQRQTRQVHVDYGLLLLEQQDLLAALPRCRGSPRPCA